jgi:hypothetical protein
MSFPLRNLDDHFNYEVHKKISKELESNLIQKLFEPGQGYTITKNTYPYKGSDYILWIHPKHQKFYTNKRIQLILGTSEFRESLEERKSIKNIKHYHVSKLQLEGSV